MNGPPNENDSTPDASQFGVPLAAALVVLVFISLAGALLLGGELRVLPASLGIGPTPTATPDPFHGVRTEAQAAFERGQRHFDQGEFELALLEFDHARVNDPDLRPDIQTMLERTLDELRSQSPPEAAAAQQPPAATPTPYTVPLGEQAQAVPTEAPAAPTPTPLPPVPTERYTSHEPAFSLDFPHDWQLTQDPPAEAGEGMVGFGPPGGDISFVISVDLVDQGMSPELYSAHLDTGMQAFPGYTLESANPALIGGLPGWRRVYSVEASALPEALRTVQVVISRQSTVFILTGTAPAGEFAATAGVFDQMLNSFRTSS